MQDGETRWKLEAGAGYQSQNARLIPIASDDPIAFKESFASTRLSSRFAHNFNDSVSFDNETELFDSNIDTYVIDESSVTSNMFGGLGLRAKSDTIARIGVIYTMN